MLSRLYLFSVTIIVTFISCNENDNLFPDPYNPFQETFRSSVFIEVIDTAGFPVADALIQLGNFTEKTNNTGMVYAKDITLGSSSYVTVKKEGYFQGSRRFYPAQGQSEYVRIILLPDSRIAFFTSSRAAEFNLKGGMTLAFPANAYEFENGTSYDGVVLVSASAISADDPDLSFKMPGDLLGLNVNSELGSLGSMGMIAVELKSTDGKKLRIKNGFDVTLKVELPEEVRFNAPPIIPLWYFEETTGLWKEEGEAVLVGNRYVGNVSHFSFWNCDAWFPTVKFSATFLFEDGSPVSQEKVIITIPELGTKSCGFTNEAGTVSGMVASGELLELEIIDDCDNTLFFDEIGPFENDIQLSAEILLPSDASKLFGIAQNCNNAAVSKGYVIINYGSESRYAPLRADGSFHFTYFNCSQDDVSIVVIDEVEETISSTNIFQPAQQINTDTIKVCQDLNEFFLINIQGYNGPISLNYLLLTIDADVTVIRTLDSIENRIWLVFEGITTGNYPDQQANIHLDLDNKSLSTQKVNVQVTSYGNLGEYVQGTFDGILLEDEFQTETFPFTGSFSLLRR